MCSGCPKKRVWLGPYGHTPSATVDRLKVTRVRKFRAAVVIVAGRVSPSLAPTSHCGARPVGAQFVSAGLRQAARARTRYGALS
jgi:hypothetical protein